MDATTITIIQTGAAAIQATAAMVFLWSVKHEDRVRKELQEQRRRDNIISLINNLWNSKRAGHMTLEEQFECPPSPRQIEFYNEELRKMGEKWKYPFKRV